MLLKTALPDDDELGVESDKTPLELKDRDIE